MVVWNCSSFLIKRNKQMYSTESNNLKGPQLLLLQRQRGHATSYEWPTINKNAQPTLSSIQLMIPKNKYHPDLLMATIHRAITILCSQKIVMVKRKWTSPTKGS
uniref:Uncharacterized protein n=1 Tax=Sus scrofa TaxID=9823 RepID=A0A8W4FIK3_PIG